MSASMTRFLASYCRLRGHSQCCQLAPPALTLAHRRTKATTRRTKPRVKKLVLKAHPEYSIWQTDKYEEQRYTLGEALTMHQEYAHPSMLDNLEGFVYADMELSMTTRKKTKFMPTVAGLLKFPHPFDLGTKRETAVFCSTEDEKDVAVRMGATIVGDTELIKMITSLQIGQSEIDEISYFLCTPEMAKAVLKLRPYLKHKTPTIKNGLVTADIESMMTEYSQCYSYESHKLTDPLSKLQIPIGKLAQTGEALEENFVAMVSHLSELKSPKLEPLIQDVSLIAPPSPESFLLKVELYVAGHETEEDEEETEEPSQVQLAAG